MGTISVTYFCFYNGTRHIPARSRFSVNKLLLPKQYVQFTNLSIDGSKTFSGILGGVPYQVLSDTNDITENFEIIFSTLEVLRILLHGTRHLTLSLMPRK